MMVFLQFGLAWVANQGTTWSALVSHFTQATGMHITHSTTYSFTHTLSTSRHTIQETHLYEFIALPSYSLHCSRPSLTEPDLPCPNVHMVEHIGPKPSISHVCLASAPHTPPSAIWVREVLLHSPTHPFMHGLTDWPPGIKWTVYSCWVMTWMTDLHYHTTNQTRSTSNMPVACIPVRELSALS